MKQILLTAFVAIAAFINHATAQFAYNFSKTTQAYAPLTSATSANKGAIWNTDTTFAIPLGFNFKMSGATISKVYLSSGNYITGTNNSATQSGFFMAGTGLIDRGTITGTSKSDIRYSTTGTAGSRIFKLEVFNAGFEDEYFNNGELKDSISIQIWLFEGSNVVEFHYGSSMVSNFSDYFGYSMKCGYLKNMDTNTLAFEKFYVVNGNVATPTIDSFTSFVSIKGLSSVPSTGTVFRFTPKGGSTGIQLVGAGTIARVFPTQCTGTLNIEHNNSRSIEYTVFNTQGQAVAHGSSSVGRHAIDLNSVSAGAYFIQIFDEDSGTYETQKFIRL